MDEQSSRETPNKDSWGQLRFDYKEKGPKERQSQHRFSLVIAFFIFYNFCILTGDIETYMYNMYESIPIKIDHPPPPRRRSDPGFAHGINSCITPPLFVLKMQYVIVR